MPHPLDHAAVRRWCTTARTALETARGEIDAINVFPVADGDTGTNLCRTFAAAVAALPEEPGEGGESMSGAPQPSPAVGAAELVRTMAHGALLGACGNSGTILAQYLRGFAGGLAEAAADAGSKPADAEYPTADEGFAPARPVTESAGAVLAHALRCAARSAYEAVAHPVEGTMLTVAAQAADAAKDAAPAEESGVEGALEVADAACTGAAGALAATTEQLGELAAAEVVDAGGTGLLALLHALREALGGPAVPRTAGARPNSPAWADRSAAAATEPGEPAALDGACASAAPEADPAPAYEVMYLIETGRGSGVPAAEGAETEQATAHIGTLRTRLDALGDSLVVGGGDGLWSVHVHVHDAGAAIEAALDLGRPHRIRVHHLAAGCAVPPPPHAPHVHAATPNDRSTTGSSTPRTPQPSPPQPHHEPGAVAPARAVVAVVPGEGLAGLCAEAGATVVPASAADPTALLDALRATGAGQAVLLPNDVELHRAAAQAATAARHAGIRTAVIPTRAAVQGLAALAVHAPELRFDEDVVAMTSAAGATRYGEVTVAAHRSWTTAGVCQEGDVLGLVEGDVALIGGTPDSDAPDVVASVAAEVVDRMLAAGGELVTLVTGADAPADLGERLRERVRTRHLGVDTVVYAGRQQAAPLLVGVE